jgi:quercetin dioxygenase-like cupin family protein
MGVIRLKDIEPKHLFPGVTHYFGVTESIGATNCQMAQVRLEAGITLAPHTHPVDDAMFVLSGKGKLIFGQEEIPIEADMFIVVPPNTRHGISNDGKDPLVIIFTWPSGKPVPRVPAP